jgi:Flp pilus assembly protein TadB
MARYATVRASDADREAVAERLRQATIEGRLTAEELEERLHAALRARTYGDLRRLIADLPASRAPWDRRPAGMLPALRVAIAIALRVAIVLTAIAVAAAVIAVAAVWWLIAAVVFLTLRGRRHHQYLKPMRR